MKIEFTHEAYGNVKNVSKKYLTNVLCPLVSLSGPADTRLIMIVKCTK